MDRRIVGKLGAVAMSAGMVAALAVSSGASAAPTAGSLSGDAAGSVPDTVELASPRMLAAVQRDLGLTAREARDQLASDLAASETEQALRSSLGNAFAGAWIDGDQLVVAVTDASQVDDVRAAGARPRVVSHSERELERVMASLDSATVGSTAPSSADVYGWHVDTASNTVEVQAAPGAVAEATEFVEASGADPAAVRVEVSTQAPEPLFDVIGGYPYFPGNFRCSIGFSVAGGFVTAGHCGGAGTSVDGYNGVFMGTVQGSSFPGNDYAWVSVNSNWTPRPWVYQWNGTVWVVDSSQEASINATVCRSGSTTGVHCGQITHKNRTVNYPQGTVFGLTRTTVCAEGGDSGGSFVAAGISAQGVTSGGSGNCTFGGITFFQPVNEILNRYNLSLVTG